MVSYLTDSAYELALAAIAVLEDEGYAFDPKQTTFNEYLATALSGIGGTPVSHLQMSTSELLAALANQMGDDTYSHLTHSMGELLSTVANGSFGPSIQLSALSVAENASVGGLVGSLSVSNGSGDYTFNITSVTGDLLELDGSDDTRVEVASALNHETVPVISLTVEATGDGDPPPRTFLINVTNILEVTLSALTLDNDDITTGAAEDTVVGALQSLSSGSTRSLTDAAGNRFKLSGTNIVAGPVATDINVADSHNITLRETHTDASNSPRDSVIPITVEDIVTFPSGALGIWYAADYEATPRKHIPNSLDPVTEPNLLMDSRRLFGPKWGDSGVTIVDNAAAAPDATMEASTFSAAAGFWFNYQDLPDMAAGTYTMWASVKRNAGSDQLFRMSLDATGYSANLTATSAFQRFSYTFAHPGGTGHSVFIIASSGNDAAELIVCDVEIFAGTTDHHAGLTGDLLLTGAVTHASDAIDLSPAGAYGQLQIPTTTLTETTVVAIVSKVGAGGDHQGLLSKIQSFTGFTAYMELEARDRFNFAGSSAGGINTGFWTFLNLGFHGVAHRYDGTNIETWLDDFRLHSTAAAALSVDVADLYVGNVTTLVETDYKLAAFAFWDRALTDEEVRQAYAFLATESGQTMMEVRLYIAEGDSITVGFGASNGSYAKLYTANADPVVHGRINAINGSNLADLTSRAARLDATLPSDLAGRKAILSVDIGAGNGDLAASASGAAYAVDVLDYCEDRLAAGWTDVVICTVLPIDGNAAHNTKRAGYNTAVRAWTNPNIHLADFAADATIGPDAAAADAGLYGDGAHPTNTAQAIMETIIRPVIDAI